MFCSLLSPKINIHIFFFFFFVVVGGGGGISFVLFPQTLVTVVKCKF